MPYVRGSISAANRFVETFPEVGCGDLKQYTMEINGPDMLGLDHVMLVKLMYRWVVVAIRGTNVPIPVLTERRP
jgi:hypothetical protein